MTGSRTDQCVAQVRDVLDSFEECVAATRRSDDSRFREQGRFVSRARAVILRVAGAHSPYGHQVEEVMSEAWSGDLKVQAVAGVLEGLLADVQQGYVLSLEELAHADVFGDFLAMADHLLSEGYKDAAAVIGGSSLEAHLRQLCSKHAVDVETDVRGEVRPKKADRMNSDLAKEGAYGKLDQKTITAWLDLRNKAAHGHYDQYSKDQVVLMVAGIRDFIARNPA